MQEILSLWTSLDARKRVILIGAVIAVGVSVLLMSRLASQTSLALLYSGLTPSAAGDVVAAVEQRGVEYEVRGSAIFVDAAQRDALRLTLASEGLPASDGQGYELLDSLSGFGTTSQMFDAAYWRAKEGELARTIAASPHVSMARVHISNQSNSPFRRDSAPTASVAVTPEMSALSSSHAQAIRYLVSSAVSGLPPESVAVIDARSGTIIEGSDINGRAAQNERASEIQDSVERLLEARVGAGKAIVEVSLETNTDRESVFERRFDPENRVAISSETEERTSTASGSQAGGVTVASNLPDGDANGNNNSSESQDSETRERLNYEVSETTREIIRIPGAIKRMTIAVLVDGIRAPDPETGEVTWSPRPEEEVADLQELVAAAVGLDTERGDEITIKSMEFQNVEVPSDTQAVPFWQTLHLDAMSIIQTAVLAIVALALGLFVIRPILTGRGSASGSQFEDDLDLGSDLGGDGMMTAAFDPSEFGDLGSAGGLDGEIDGGGGGLPGTAMFADDAMMDPDQFAMTDDPVERLRELIDERKDETIEVLRSWMEESGQEQV